MRTTRFGNGEEKVRKCTETKPDAMAARKKVKDENGPLDDLEQNEDGRGCYQSLLKTSEAADRNPSRTADVLRRRDEKRADGVENRSCEPPGTGLRRLPSFSSHWGFSTVASVGDNARPGMILSGDRCRQERSITHTWNSWVLE